MIVHIEKQKFQEKEENFATFTTMLELLFIRIQFSFRFSLIIK